MSKQTIEKVTNEFNGAHTYTMHVNGGTLQMIVKTTRCDMSRRMDLMRVWVKRGYLAAPIRERLDLECVYTHADGTQTGAAKLNPTVKIREDGRVVINFDWMLPATDENEKKLIGEVIKRASDVFGEEF